MTTEERNMPAQRNGTEQNGTISARQERVAACLAAGMTKTRAARECRVGLVTIWTWLKQAAFRERLAELRRELVDGAIGRLADLMAGLALDALKRRLEAKDKAGKPAVTLDDIKATFELFLNTTNAADLKARIEELELLQRGSR
jgi:hypothetical protein